MFCAIYQFLKLKKGLFLAIHFTHLIFIDLKVLNTGSFLITKTAVESRSI